MFIFQRSVHRNCHCQVQRTVFLRKCQHQHLDNSTLYKHLSYGIKQNRFPNLSEMLKLPICSQMMHFLLNIRTDSNFVFTKVSDRKTLHRGHFTESNIMYMWFWLPSVNLNDNYSFCITLWSINSVSSSRSQWKLFSHHLNGSFPTYSKRCGNRFDRCPCRLNTLYEWMNAVLKIL